MPQPSFTRHLPHHIDTPDFSLPQFLQKVRFFLIRSCLVVAGTTCFTFTSSGKIVSLLQKPLLDILPEARRHLYFTGIADKFLVHLKISVLVSLGLTIPYLLFEIWRLAAPFLEKKFKRFVVPFLFFGTFNFCAGLAFAYYLMLPLGYRYLVEFGSPEDLPLITLTEYFNLTTGILFISGLVFELPLLMILLGMLGILTHTFLNQYQRHAIFLITVLSVIATPSPDIVTYLSVCGLLVLLFELGVVGVWVVSRRKTSKSGELLS